MDEILTKDFSNEKGKKYRYDFNLLTVEQAELAREIGEWKANQLQSGTDSVSKLLSSRGADYLSMIMSYLLREVKDDIVQAFSRDKAESEVEPFVKSLPAVRLIDLKDCIIDFFTNTGKKPVGLLILEGGKKKNAIEALLPILLQMNASKKD